jgi:hypothetical protein
VTVAAWEDALRAEQPVLRHHRRQGKTNIIRRPPLTPRRRQARSPQETGCRKHQRCTCACAPIDVERPRTAPHPCQRRAKARCGASSIPESTSTCAFCEGCRCSDTAFFCHEELIRHADRRQASPASAGRWRCAWSRKRLDPGAPDAQSRRARSGGHGDGHDAHGSKIGILHQRRAISSQRRQLRCCIIIPKSQHHPAVRPKADPCRKHSYDAEQHTESRQAERWMGDQEQQEQPRAGRVAPGAD